MLLECICRVPSALPHVGDAMDDQSVVNAVIGQFFRFLTSSNSRWPILRQDLDTKVHVTQPVNILVQHAPVEDHAVDSAE